MIDWKDPNAKVSKYFTVKELSYLPGWQILAANCEGIEFGDDQQEALKDLACGLDGAREILGVPMVVHCAFRPPVYNQLCGGAPESYHVARNIGRPTKRKIYVAAMDFHPDFQGLDQVSCCAKGIEMLKPHLEDLGMRMENRIGDWIHLDSKPVPEGGNRFFKP